MSGDNRAVVATGHPQASGAAAEILSKGGNAFDAAVAAGFAAAVVEPTLTSLGGGGFLLARTAEGREILFDFFVDTPGMGLTLTDLEPHFFPVTIRFPGSDQVFNVGFGSVAVPGNLKGFLHVHQSLGSLPLKEILDPAVGYARNGVILNAHQAYFNDLLKPINTLTEEGRKLYAPEGKYVARGELLSNPDLADFLEELPRDGGRSFYEGELCRKIAADMERQGGLLTVEDLHSYRVMERSPLEVRYRGRRLLANPAPSFGGGLLAVALRLLEYASFEHVGWASPAHISALGRVMFEVEQQREAGGYRLEAFPAEWFEKKGIALRTFSRGTTHVSVADAYGNAASMTTSNGEGSGYIVPGTGIMLNNMMGEDDLHPEGFHSTPPGRRVASMMSPSLLVRKGGVELVFGSGGSKRIRTALMQVLCNLVDFGLDIEEAVQAPRIHWDGETMQAEPGFAEETLDALRAEWPVNVWKEKDVYFGGVHAVLPGRRGAGDPRRGGASVVVEQPPCHSSLSGLTKPI